jgi:hypothetical protein
MAFADDALEPEVAVRPPSLFGALREALSDFFYNSWRLVPVNVLWGLWFILVVGVWSSVNLAAAAVLVPVLAIPLAGIARMAGLATRGESIGLSDALQPLRQRLRPLVVSAIAFTVALVILVANVVTGLAIGGLVGVALATASAWGLVVLAGFGITWWPLLTDPVHDAVSATNLARLCALLLLAHPLRFGLLVVIVVGILLASTILFAAVITISVAYVMLVAARYVLPAADRLEERLGLRTRVTGETEG